MLAAKKRSAKLLSFDAFAKTEEEVRVRTNTGGIITLSCIIVTLYLLLNEWSQFNSVITSPQLVVDRDRNLKLELNFDVTFPSISCDLINLDIMDDSGELQLDLLDSAFTKIRVDADGNELGSSTLEVGTDDLASEVQQRNNDPDYCGSCYGSKVQDENDKLPRESRVCCQTCNDVREAYLNIGWGFFDGKGIEQCEKEGYVAKINEHLKEGCRVKGQTLLSRIQGNIHFAPGKSYTSYKRSTSASHYHDTSLYDKTSNLNFNHKINHLSFGKPIDKLDEKVQDHSTEFSISPLDGREVIPTDIDTHYHVYSYYAKIVPTRYEFLNKKEKSIETAQFSTTFHSRPLRGGRDADHPTTMHSQGGIPGLFIYFEMSAVKVINKEHHFRSWSSFLLNCITTVGSVLAVGTVSDKIFYRAQKSLQGKKNQ
ncbi:hypothetical protein NCAS_0A07550 [Naumovozyma castellii]|uniref:Endoplasmic reticulum-Golgi intermediate compartment protein n=1 Tax=Naumovozyma castellii TaxID=27288 RepID=G0V765_NAUCA|nr:hypothetical protein NCAS_0A07550 [Naumovozyma castellii CBS 4309]CCC67313.1 hypothetical protein NCAS_0A07550 [Naumovozyma castellii CBS 4309]